MPGVWWEIFTIYRLDNFCGAAAASTCPACVPRPKSTLSTPRLGGNPMNYALYAGEAFKAK